MKRHPDLVELSDDHHQGLVNALRLKKAASGDGAEPADAARAFLKFWREDTMLHFRKEEEALLPVVARYAEELLECEPVMEMLAQHARIRGLVMQLDEEVARNEVRAETLQELGEQLQAHIRLEEREVFPLIEEVLPEAALHNVAARLKVFASTIEADN